MEWEVGHWCFLSGLRKGGKKSFVTRPCFFSLHTHFTGIMEAVKQRMAALKDEAQQATERAEKADLSLKVG